MAQHVSERRQLVPAVSLLSAIVDSSDDAIISKDLDGVITSWNKGAERLFGYTADEAIGRSVAMLIPPDRFDEERAILEQLRRGDRVDHFETIRVRKDGMKLNVSLTISPVIGHHGRIVGASKIFRDITERVRQGEALRQANAALKRANDNLEQFIHSASHDLQEPLRTVTVYCELLQRRFSGQLGQAGNEYIRHAMDSATRMERLLEDLRSYLNVSMTESVPLEDASAGAVLKKVLTNLEAAIRENDATISSSALPRVRMHEFQLEQIFQNLIGNAIRYRKIEPPRIDISALRQDHEWLFSVQDIGIGIAPEFRQQVFGLFKRLHRAAAYPGTGMGLAICQRIIERVGGQIWVESELGRGSTFFFTVPTSES